MKIKSRPLWSDFDVPRKQKIIEQIEKDLLSPHFWDDAKEAQKKMQLLTSVKSDLSSWLELKKEAANLSELFQLSLKEQDNPLEDSLANNIQQLRNKLKDLELLTLFTGNYDERSIFLSIHAGAGGTESQDWANMLLNMYLQRAGTINLKTSIIDSSPGEEAGIKSVIVEMQGKNAYGHFKSERGVHRLVRLSPFDNANLRHTSFALVEILPLVGSDAEIALNADDLRIDVFRAGGHGGQSVQKTSSAVRIVHIPSGTTVSCQNERSQRQNKEIAMKILRARLMELEIKRQKEEELKLKGEHVPPEWGNQIRSYVLHPYKLVKDHRTNFETTDADAVLSGDIEDFERAFLLSTLGAEET